MMADKVRILYTLNPFYDQQTNPNKVLITDLITKMSVWTCKIHPSRCTGSTPEADIKFVPPAIVKITCYNWHQHNI